MKKFIFATMVALMGLVSAKAASFGMQPLLNPGIISLTVSNGNGKAITNLACKWMSWGGWASRTNVANIVWTNSAGVQVVNTQANMTNYFTDKFNLLGIASLYPAPGGGAWSPTMNTTVTRDGANSTNSVAQDTASGGFQNGSIVVELQGRPEFDSTATFTFCPVIVADNGTIYQASNVNDDWVVSFTGVASTAGTNMMFITNAPVARWNGYNGLMLRTVVNDDSTGSADTAFVLKKVYYCGWKP